MRIAFVGKGGSGKTTIAALFTSYLIRENKPILAIDADINMHFGELLGFDMQVPLEKQLSTPVASDSIKTYLKGDNKRIKDISDFKKTTPPTADSNFLILSDSKNPLLNGFSLHSGNIFFMAVGTYDTETIGTACYHNNLAILESLLSHTIDKNGYVVVDMVAGTDAFANTLHSQFDLLTLIIEPTTKGVEVFKQYYQLARGAGIEDNIVVIGNKIRDENDEAFIREIVPERMLLGFFGDSEYLRKHDRVGGAISVDSIEKNNFTIIEKLFARLSNIKQDSRKRLERLWDLHTRYVSQDYIKNASGDLTNQIDRSFDPEMIANK